MSVAELIAELSKHDPMLPVYLIDGDDGSYESCGTVEFQPQALGSKPAVVLDR